MNKSWKNDLLLQDGFSSETLNTQFVVSIQPVDENYHKGYWDIDYEAGINDPYRTLGAEHPYYIKNIDEALAHLNIKNNEAVVADLGCGDGRFINYFLKKGFKKIVGVDISRKNLVRLAERISKVSEGSDKVLLLEGDIANPPLKPNSFDLIIAVGVLLVLNERYAEGVKRCASLLKPGGLLLTVDPTDYGAAMYAIARHNLAEIAKVVETKTKTVDIEDTNAPRYSVRSAEAMQEAHLEAGLELIQVKGIPLFPSLLFGALKQLQTYSQEEIEKMKQLNDALIETFPQSWRAACLLSKKNG